MEYNTDLFEADTVKELMEQYRRLMEEFLEDPDRPLSETPTIQKVLSVYTDFFLL